MAEDEFDPIPVLITKNTQGKKEAGEKRKLDISSHQSNVPSLHGEWEHHRLVKDTG